MHIPRLFPCSQASGRLWQTEAARTDPNVRAREIGKHIDKAWVLAYTQQEKKNLIGVIEPGRVA